MSEVASVVDPDYLFTTLVASAVHPKKKRNLIALHQICAERFKAKALVWTYTSLGKLLQEQHLLTVQSLLQRQSADYRALIDAWRAKTEAVLVTEPKRTGRIEGTWYDNIDDLWARQTAASLDREVVELRRKNQLLEKWKGTVTIRLDGRPVDRLDGVQEVVGPELSVQEKRALADSLSPKALSRVRLNIGPRGELLTEDGVVLFSAGWATGLKKLLGAELK